MEHISENSVSGVSNQALQIPNEPLHEKTNNLGFRPGPIYSTVTEAGELEISDIRRS